MTGGWSTIPPPIPSTTWTSTTPTGDSTSTSQLLDHWSLRMGQYPPTSPPPHQSSTPLSLTDSSLSSTPSPTRANSTETSANPISINRGRSLNVAAIAIGVTGAALLLIVCTVIAFILWKRKQRNKVPPSAEFKDLTWNPKFHHRTAQSITSSVFTPKDRMSFTSPYELTKYNIPVSPGFSPHPNTPPWSS